MRVLLLRPNSSVSNAPPPLGLGYVAQALRQARNDAIQILDARLLRLSGENLAQRIREFAPHVLGISVSDFDRDNALEAARAARREVPGLRVVLGGPYVSANREKVLEDPEVDVGVVGEGEVTAVELFDALDGGGDLSRIPGIVFRDQGVPRFTGHREFLTDLDRIRPAWDLLDPFAYFRPLSSSTIIRVRQHYRALPVVTSRGCPYGCIYCHKVFGKTFRAMSPGAVVEELAYLQERFGMRQVDLVEDTFNADPARARTILETIRDRDMGLVLSFFNGMRSDLLDEPMLDLVRDAGGYNLAFAVESGSPRVQKIIKKGLDLERVRDMISAAVSKGLFANGLFILGFPTETAEEMEQTIEFACKSKLHGAMFFYLNPFPGTEVGEMAEKMGRQVDSYNFFSMHANLSAVPDEVLYRMSRRAYRRFYLNPGRMARVFARMPKNPSSLMPLGIMANLLVRDGYR
ncbi:MAG: B12-binding domain-containing radical SAM protein [Proteobacteria bacterium]|nr:B12-binding domain-containing radical SAM protein [Pseudomonadota bacterium]